MTKLTAAMNPCPCGYYCNSQIPSRMFHEVGRISESGNQLLKTAMEKLDFLRGLMTGF